MWSAEESGIAIKKRGKSQVKMMLGSSDAAKVRLHAKSEMVLSSLCEQKFTLFSKRGLLNKSSFGRIGVKHRERTLFNFSLVGYEWKLTKDWKADAVIIWFPCGNKHWWHPVPHGLAHLSSTEELVQDEFSSWGQLLTTRTYNSMAPSL